MDSANTNEIHDGYKPSNFTNIRGWNSQTEYSISTPNHAIVLPKTKGNQVLLKTDAGKVPVLSANVSCSTPMDLRMLR